MRRLQFWFSLAEILAKKMVPSRSYARATSKTFNEIAAAIHFWSGMASILTWASRITDSGPTPERRVMMHRNRRRITELSMTFSFNIFYARWLSRAQCSEDGSMCYDLSVGFYLHIRTLRRSIIEPCPISVRTLKSALSKRKSLSLVRGTVLGRYS